MIDRRHVIAGALALAAFAPRADRLAAQALARAGGRAALSRVRLLTWEGRAVVHAGGRDIAIGVSTEVAPFVWARSRSWLASEGPAKARIMTITPTGGWLERDDRQTALDPAVTAHERAQFAIYGLMLLPAIETAERLPDAPTDLRGLRLRHAAAPVTDLWFDAQGRLAEATNRVPDAEGGAPIAQRFVFEGEVTSAGVRWPRRLRIDQAGEPYFELTLDRFDAGLEAPPTPS